ncbi:DUF4352 domain-containing protein [Streptomyces europaeiscabiei]|uniref:DUF4352 domain-containing protein n=1 Tax=Streptomyces europaeiscabiei TaxID=146819 RepID=UPI0029B66058|nr:DUF4352 domain-containing protein [Streptomyces europaeiscabiei]MDX3714413.1 DUF4352 domain-containing protein [Streptomyces europaeiscabiei]
MRTRIHTITALAAASLLALTACSTGGETVSTKPKTSTSKGAKTEKKADTPPAEKEKVAAVGDTLTLKGMEDGEQLDVTLKQWLPTAKPSTEFDIPQDGKRWAAAQFELVNTGSKVYADSPQNGAKAADSKGQRFDSWFGEISAGPAMSSDVSLPKGEKALGWIVFEVPKDSKIVSVQFAMNSGFSNQTGQWTVK